MRKYRGLTKEGEWVYGWYAEINHKSFIVTEIKGEGRKLLPDLYIGYSDFCVDFTEIDPKTVGQQVGLKDKNGTEIYEGDILRYADLLSDEWMMSKEKTIGIVNWIKGKCAFQPQEIKENYKNGHFLALWDSIDEVEVIGNIHQNPELME